MAVVVVAYIYVRIVPQCVRVLVDYDVELPHVTIMVMKLSYALVNFWYLLILALPPVALVYLLLRRTSPRFNWLASVVLVLPLVLAILLLGFTAFVLDMPLAGAAHATRRRRQPAGCGA